MVPFTVRDFEIAPGIVIRGAFANSVSVADGYRDRGIGTRMMAEARRFLPCWADAMFVYTGGEREAPQYRFYVKTGHYDLSYPRRLRQTQPTGALLPHGAEVLPVTAAGTLEGDLLDVYTQCYAGCAGTWQRKPGYWRRALASHIFVEFPYDSLLLLVLWHRATLHAYALVGLRGGEMIVLEAAARGEAAADELWQAVGAQAGAHGARAMVVYGQDLNTPLYASVRRAAFLPEPRSAVLVGQALAPEVLCARRWEAVPGAPDMTLDVWTPQRLVTLRPTNGGAMLSLEMKEETLHRLLLARVDLEAALREQRVTVRDGTWDLIRQVAAVLRPVPWVYHHLDNI